MAPPARVYGKRAKAPAAGFNTFLSPAKDEGKTQTQTKREPKKEPAEIDINEIQDKLQSLQVQDSDDDIVEIDEESFLQSCRKNRKNGVTGDHPPRPASRNKKSASLNRRNDDVEDSEELPHSRVRSKKILNPTNGNATKKSDPNEGANIARTETNFTGTKAHGINTSTVKQTSSTKIKKKDHKDDGRLGETSKKTDRRKKDLSKSTGRCRRIFDPLFLDVVQYD